MSKNKIILSALIVGLLIPAANRLTGQEAELTVPPELLSQWDSALKGEPLSVVDVDLPAFKETEQGAERFARRFLDFNQAKKSVLEKGQTELFQLNENANRALFLSGQQGRALASKEKIQYLFRRGQNRYSFTKFLVGPGCSLLPEARAVAAARDFLRRERLLPTGTETDLEKTETGSSYILSQEGKKRIVGQTVRFRRTLGGKRVFNSSIFIHFYPENLELLSLRLNQWGRIKGQAANQARAKKLSSAQEYLRLLRRRLALIKRKGQGKFKLASVELGYRMHENQLVPGFECSVELRKQVKGRETVDGLVFFLALNGEDLTAGEEGEATQPKAAAGRKEPPERTGAGLKHLRKPG